MKVFHLSLKSLWSYLPALLGGIVCLVVTLFTANFVSKIVYRFTQKRTKDVLIAHFMGKIFWTIVFTIGVVLALGILGLGTISNKILAAAGITTFVVGFAMKDIGENFLAGLMLAFGRPFRVGNTIECSGISGAVKDMTLRQTTVETADGKIVLIPNSLIVNNPLAVYKRTDILSDSFQLHVKTSDTRKAIDLIEKTINASGLVVNNSEKTTRAIADSLTGDKALVQVTYWTDVVKQKTSRAELKSSVMLLVMDQLKKENIGFTG